MNKFIKLLNKIILMSFCSFLALPDASFAMGRQESTYFLAQESTSEQTSDLEFNKKQKQILLTLNEAREQVKILEEKLDATEDVRSNIMEEYDMQHAILLAINSAKARVDKLVEELESNLEASTAFNEVIREFESIPLDDLNACIKEFDTLKPSSPYLDESNNASDSPSNTNLWEDDPCLRNLMRNSNTSSGYSSNGRPTPTPSPFTTKNILKRIDEAICPQTPPPFLGSSAKSSAYSSSTSIVIPKDDETIAAELIKITEAPSMGSGKKPNQFVLIGANGTNYQITYNFSKVSWDDVLMAKLENSLDKLNQELKKQEDIFKKALKENFLTFRDGKKLSGSVTQMVDIIRDYGVHNKEKTNVMRFGNDYRQTLGKINAIKEKFLELYAQGSINFCADWQKLVSLFKIDITNFKKNFVEKYFLDKFSSLIYSNEEVQMAKASDFDHALTPEVICNVLQNPASHACITQIPGTHERSFTIMCPVLRTIKQVNAQDKNEKRLIIICFNKHGLISHACAHKLTENFVDPIESVNLKITVDNNLKINIARK